VAAANASADAVGAAAAADAAAAARRLDELETEVARLVSANDALQRATDEALTRADAARAEADSARRQVGELLAAGTAAARRGAECEAVQQRHDAELAALRAEVEALSQVRPSPSHHSPLPLSPSPTWDRSNA